MVNERLTPMFGWNDPYRIFDCNYTLTKHPPKSTGPDSRNSVSITHKCELSASVTVLKYLPSSFSDFVIVHGSNTYGKVIGTILTELGEVPFSKEFLNPVANDLRVFEGPTSIHT